jgi:lysophospholipase L1-like esterase
MATGGVGGEAGAMTGGAGGAGGMEMPHEDLGKGDGNDVVTIGDSWMSYFVNGGGIEGALDRADTNYRHYGVAGTTLGSSIPPQWDSAKRAGADIKTVIMTGGGNDIMFSGGCATKESCEAAVQAISDMLDELWTQMSNDGVLDVVYIQYSKNAGSTPPENRPTTSPTPSICIRGPLRCHTVPTTDLVGPSDTVDGIHPTSAANDRIATAIIQVMEEQGIRR